VEHARQSKLTAVTVVFDNGTEFESVTVSWTGAR
jgi:hypothetical protein